MKRFVLVLIALVAALAFTVPAVLGAQPMAHTGRVLISVRGDVVVPAGEQADAVVVVDGTATIRGAVNTLVVVRGTANLEGGRLDTVVAVNSRVEVLDGTVIQGQLKQLDSTIHQVGNVEIIGGITDLSADLLWIGAMLAPALALLWLGFGLATIVAALIVAAIASRHIRRAEALISRDPLVTGVVGLVAAVALPVLAILSAATVIGAPLGIGFLFGVLPLMAFAGYIVAAISLGEWLLRRTVGGPDRTPPYLAAVIGIVLLGAAGLVPVLGLLAMIASLLGFGALLRLGWRAMRGTPDSAVATTTAPLGRSRPTAEGGASA